MCLERLKTLVLLHVWLDTSTRRIGQKTHPLPPVARGRRTAFAAFCGVMCLEAVTNVSSQPDVSRCLLRRSGPQKVSLEQCSLTYSLKLDGQIDMAGQIKSCYRPRHSHQTPVDAAEPEDFVSAPRGPKRSSARCTVWPTTVAHPAPPTVAAPHRLDGQTVKTRRLVRPRLAARHGQTVKRPSWPHP